MNIGSWILALLVLIVFSSCRKEGSTGPRIWEGRVLEYGSDKPVAGARVYLWEGSSEWWGQSSEYRIDSTESAADGSFRFSYERVGGRYYRITGGADQYYPGEAFLERTSSTRADLVLDPYAWVRIHVKNVNPVNENDFLSLNTNSCSERAFLGMSVDQFTVCQYRGNREYSFIYSTVRAGKGDENRTFEFSTGAIDTLEYELFY